MINQLYVWTLYNFYSEFNFHSIKLKLLVVTHLLCITQTRGFPLRCYKGITSKIDYILTVTKVKGSLFSRNLASATLPSVVFVLSMRKVRISLVIVFILSMSMVELSVFSRDSSTANKVEASVLVDFILSMSKVRINLFLRDSSTTNKVEGSILIVFILSMSKARNPSSHAIPRQQIRSRLLLVSYFIGEFLLELYKEPTSRNKKSKTGSNWTSKCQRRYLQIFLRNFILKYPWRDEMGWLVHIGRIRATGIFVVRKLTLDRTPHLTTLPSPPGQDHSLCILILCSAHLSQKGKWNESVLILKKVIQI